MNRNLRHHIRLVHTLPGRTRVRLSWLRRRPSEELQALTDALATEPGVEDVEIRPATGSVMVWHDEERLEVDELLEVLRRHTGGVPVVRPGEPAPYDPEVMDRVMKEGSVVARAAVRFFLEVNKDVLRATEGRVDLGLLMALGFLSLGIGEVTTSGKLQLPPWYSLSWWAFRTFTTVERSAQLEPAAEH